MKFYHLTDLHYSSKSVWKGNSWDMGKEEDAVLARYSEEIVKKVIDDIKIDKDVDTVIITGDITNQGGKDSHKEMVEMLRSLTKSGKKVYAMVASHDFKWDPYIIDDKGNRLASDDITTEEEAYAYYKEFGFNQAISYDKYTSSYVVQLNDKIRYVAVNPLYSNKKVNSGMYFSDNFMLWIKEQADKAESDGCILIGGVHYPILTPSPVYKMIGGVDCFIKDSSEIAQQFADMGINLFFAGHTHIHSINNMLSEKGNNFFQVTTSALTSYPTFYRKIEIDEETGNVKINSIEAGNILVDGHTINVKEAAKNNFISLIEPVVEKMQYDANALTVIGGEMENKGDVLKKYNFIITRSAKFLYKLKFGKIAKYVKKESGLKKNEIASVKDKRVLPFIAQLIASLYDGKQEYNPESKEYKIFMGMVAVLDSIIKSLHINIEKRTHTKDLYDLIEPLLYNAGLDNYTCEFNLKTSCTNNQIYKIKSKKGWKIVTIASLCAILFSPILLPLFLIILLWFKFK